MLHRLTSRTDTPSVQPRRQHSDVHDTGSQTHHMTITGHEQSLRELIYPTLVAELALVRDADQTFFAPKSLEGLPGLRDLQVVHAVSPCVVLRQCWLLYQRRQWTND